MRRIVEYFLTCLAILLIVSCNNKSKKEVKLTTDELMEKIEDFVPFTLSTDLSDLTDNQKKMIPILIDIAKIMDEIYWIEAYGDKQKLMELVKTEAEKKYIEINYGPWERLNEDKPFISGVGPKPLGANFYPSDITKEEFEALEDPEKSSQYTLIRRGDDGKLEVIPYHVAFKGKIEKAAKLMKEAAELADDEGFKNYLILRSEALLTDDYLKSDMAWMDMKNNKIEFIAGPIEHYEDQLYGTKTAHEAYIMIKDLEWSNRLMKYASLLPQLQRELPVPEMYKQETPGTNSDLNAYDVIYYAGNCNAGAKTIAINLPNDERVHLEKGSRRMQLKNSTRAKFEKILVPISKVVIAEDQLENISFDAFFATTMFHEVAHGLGLKKVINSEKTVREALAETYTTLEEGKADILGLYLLTKLSELGEYDGNLMDNYVTFLAGIFRSIRFGATEAHGKSNLMRFNYFKEHGAFNQGEDGKYSVEFEKMKIAMNSLSSLILTIQGNGDYEKAKEVIEKYVVETDDLKASLQKIDENNIPVDIVFEQGLSVLGLE